MPVRVPIEDVRRGDEIQLRRLGARVVSDVRCFDDVYVLVYYHDVELSYESSKTGGYGARSRTRVVERSLRPMEKGELVDVVARGSTGRADQYRRELEERRDGLLEAG